MRRLTVARVLLLILEICCKVPVLDYLWQCTSLVSHHTRERKRLYAHDDARLFEHISDAEKLHQRLGTYARIYSGMLEKRPKFGRKTHVPISKEPVEERLLAQTVSPEG
jgi:hypothetical protein